MGRGTKSRPLPIENFVEVFNHDGKPITGVPSLKTDYLELECSHEGKDIITLSHCMLDIVGDIPIEGVFDTHNDTRETRKNIGEITVAPDDFLFIKSFENKCGIKIKPRLKDVFLNYRVVFSILFSEESEGNLSSEINMPYYCILDPFVKVSSGN